MPDMFENMYEDLCGNGFFKGVSGHFVASADHELSDDAVGKEIILRKVKRMQDKMVDTEKYYTFDLLEELIFAHMIECAQEIAEDDAYYWDKEAEMKTEAELKEKFGFSEIDARKVARQCYRLFEMGPEDDAWMEDFEEESLKALAENIRTFQRIENENGSVDDFIIADSADVIVQRLSKGRSPYKLKMLGEALVWEYLRNVGVDGAKPDTHMRRFLGADRMGSGKNAPATINEVNEQVAEISEETGLSMAEVYRDAIFIPSEETGNSGRILLQDEPSLAGQHESGGIRSRA